MHNDAFSFVKVYIFTRFNLASRLHKSDQTIKRLFVCLSFSCAFPKRLVYLFVCFCMCLSYTFCLLVRLFVCLFFHLPFLYVLSTCSFICLFFHVPFLYVLSICSFVCFLCAFPIRFVCLFVCFFMCLSYTLCLLVRSFVCFFSLLSYTFCLPVRLFVCLFVFEGFLWFLMSMMSIQVNNHFDFKHDPCISAYRKKRSCETTLLRLIEDWKLAVDSEQFIGILSKDMSKAFDSLHPSLMINKLKACDFSEESLSLIRSYFSNRQNRVKLNGVTSSWKDAVRGCPQGSSFGPLLWNIFQNDTTYIVNMQACQCTLTTISCM